MTDEIDIEKGEKRPKKTWKTVLTVVALVALTAAGVIIWLSQSPAIGTIHVVEREEESVESMPLPLSEFEGRYVSFTYPAEYEPRSIEEDEISLEKGLFVASGPSSRMFAFSVADARGKLFSDFPSFQLRNFVKTQDYLREERPLSGFDAIVFTKSEEGYEKTAFVIQSDRLLTVSVSGTVFSDPGAIRRDFELITGSLGFRE